MHHTDTLLDFDWTLDPKLLRKTYKSTDFDSQFYQLINKNVIKILAPQKFDELHNLTYDEDLIYEKLICPLERFICGLSDSSSQDDVQRALDSIIALNQPSKLCRRILKNGDVTFACNDCGLDGTCVVCIDCFHKGAHKDHNYRMSNTDGGGCCDCGDPEAWKQNYACTDHMASDQPNLTFASFEDPQQRANVINSDKKRILEIIGRLPPGIATRYFMVCQASLHYARMLISWTEYESLPKCLDIDDSTTDDAELLNLLSKDHSSTNYFTVLYNDEVHTYDFVIGTLVRFIRCTRLTASFMASTVSREGRCLLINDDYSACRHLREDIATARDSGQNGEPLKVEAIHGTVLAHQAFAFKLLEWIRKMTTICDSFRILTAYTLLGTHEPIAGLEGGSSVSDMTLIEKIMLSNTIYWKIARIEWNDLFVKSMLTEYSIKEQFARLLTRLYPRLMQDFMRDDHDPSVSILSMTTQLYTVPSLTCMLIEEENALTVLYKTFSDACNNARRENMPVSFENRKTFDMSLLKRGFHTLMDVKYLLGFQPTKWTNQLRKNVVEAVSTVVELLTSLQGMDSVRRQLGNHLEYEPDWESGMSIQTRLSPNISRLIQFCGYDEQVLLNILKRAQLKLLRCTGGYKMIAKELFGHQVNCIQYDVSTSPVSVHLPLSRFVVALINELMQRRPCDRMPYDESFVILAQDEDEEVDMKNSTLLDIDEPDSKRPEGDRGGVNGHSMIDIMEPSLRTCVMVAQFRSGMWRRNGYSLINQINFYHSPPLRKEMFGRDILALQECGAMCEANQFMIHLLNKFQLFTWSENETTRAPMANRKSVSFQNDEEIIQHTMSLGEEFLQLVLTIVGERYRVGIGKIEPDDVLKNEIIQLLCMGPLTRSDISHRLSVFNDNELDCIKTIANLKRTTESQTGKYELKEEFHERFNPYFYHYVRRDQSNALDAQLKRKRNLGESLVCCPPPKPVELTLQYSNLNQILKCDILLILIEKVLTRAIGAPDSALECPSKAPIRFTATDLQLDQCLHLIGLGLYEQERCPLEFNYLQAANEKGIFTTLKGVYEDAKRSKDLITWLMKKSNDLIDRIVKDYGGDQEDPLDEATTNNLDSIRDILGSILSISDTSKQDGKKRNSELAALRRERIMAMMKMNQEKFLSNPSTKQLVAETEKNQAGSKSSNPSSTAPAAVMNVAHSSGSSLTGLKTRRMGGPSQSGPRLKIKSISGKSTASGEQASGTATSGAAMSNNNSSSNKNVDDATTTRMDQNTDSDNQMDYESTHELDEDRAVAEEDEEEEDNADDEPEPMHMCILCRDEQKIGFEQQTMVLLTYIQRSTVLSKSRGSRRIPYYELTPSNNMRFQNLFQARGRRNQATPDMYSFTSDNSWSFDATHMPADLFFGPHVSTCGHVMHFECWKGFVVAINKRETIRPNRSARPVSFELQRQEILCPLCECISNATIPLLPNYTRFATRLLSPETSPERLALMRGSVFATPPEVIEASSENLSSCLRALRSAVVAYKHVRHIKESASSSASAANLSQDEKYMRLLQPNNINDALENLNESDALGLRDFINTVRANRIGANICNNGSLLPSISFLADRIHIVGLDLDRGGLGEVNHARKFMMTSWSISYTIQAAERAARFKGSPLFEELQSSSSLCLSSLLKFACASTMIHQQDTIQSYLVGRLRYLLINDEHYKSSPCCLDIDAFEMLVSILIVLQKLYTHMEDSEINLTKQQASSQQHQETSNKSAATDQQQQQQQQQRQTPPNQLDLGSYGWATQAYDHEYFRNLVHLMLVLNMLQVMISLQNDLATSPILLFAAESSTEVQQSGDAEQQEEGGDTKMLSAFYKEIILASGHPNSCTPNVDGEFVNKIKASLLPFLRSCALYFYHLSQIQPPQVLRTKSAFFEGKDFVEPAEPAATSTTGLSPMSVDCSSSDDIQQPQQPAAVDMEAICVEYDAICQYLNLPNKFSVLLKSQEVRHLARAWLRHPRVVVLIESAIREQRNGQQLRQQQLKRNQEAECHLLHQSRSASTITKTSLRRSGSSSSSVSSCQQAATQAAAAVVAASASPKSDLMPVKFIAQPHLVNRLIDLPHDYSELVDRVSDFTCPSIKNEDSRTPTMCLVCGLMLCSQNYCCQRDLNDLASNYQQVLQRYHQQQQHNSSSSSSSSRSLTLSGHETRSATEQHATAVAAAAAAAALFPFGSPGTPQETHTIEWIEHPASGLSPGGSGGLSAPISQQLVGSCTYHAYECSGGVGVFLRIRNCQILLLSGKSKGCYMPAPYIDDHGEFDFGMLRGNPMFLNRRHYEKFQQMWLTHAIPRQISRMLEYSTYASSINWHLH